MNRRAILLFENLVLRIGELKPAAAAHLRGAEQHHLLARREDVAQKRLIQPDGPKRAARIADERLENLETRASG